MDIPNPAVTRILVLDDNPIRREAVASSLESSGCLVVARISANEDILTATTRAFPDVLLAVLDSPNTAVLGRLGQCYQERPRPMVVFTEDGSQEKIREALGAGVSSYVVNGLRKDRIKSVIDVAVARFEKHQQLRTELQDAQQRLEERTQVDRAKALMIKRLGLSEEAAHRRLQQLAMNQQRRIGEAAREIISLLQPAEE